MANQKSNIHEIPLKTTDLCLNKFNADIKPYSGFRKNNSPFYGNTLSPFYYKRATAVGKRSYVHNDGIIYTIKDDGNLYSIANNEVKLLDLSNGYFLDRKVLSSSGNDTYRSILGFFDEYDGEDTMLCSSYEGNLAILYKDGTVKHLITMSDGYTYKGNETVGFMEHEENGAYCFVLGNSIFCTNLSGTTAYRYAVGDASSRASNYSYSCVSSPETSTYTVCFKLKSSITSTLVNIIYGDAVSFNLVTQVKGLTSSTPIMDVHADGRHNLFFTRNGDAVLSSNVFRKQVASQYEVYNFAKDLKRGVSDGPDTVSCTIDQTKFINIDNLSEDKYEGLSSICDNYAAIEVVGYSNGGYTKTIPGEWHVGVIPIVVTVPQVVSIPNGTGGFITMTYDIPQVVGYQSYTYKDDDRYEHVPGGYRATILNGSTRESFKCVPIHNDGTYTGGLISTIGDNFRCLYHSGVLQAISVCQDDRTVGTLLCGIGEIDDTYPICYSGSKNTVYYKDSSNWVQVSLTQDPNKATLSLANGRYLIINTNQYYNCYDVVDHSLHHYASDWNDRTVLDCEATFRDTPNTLAGYLSNCEQYSFASGQGSNYVALDTPFISSLFTANTGYLPKQITVLTPRLLAGYTPNNQDIDVYYGRLVDDSLAPYYKYSVDMENSEYLTYINAALSGSRYTETSLTLTPSIFAEFISGFINQGIIIDNGHSYIQKFANTSKPIFAIDLASQLEGVTSSFIIQGQYFVIIDNSVYRYDPESGAISAVVNIANMQLIGYTPYMAIFWSGTNKTFYTFVGDNTLSVLVQADEIIDIIYSAYNPNTMSIYIVTDDSIYILGNDQLLRLELEGYTKCYPLYSGVAFTGENDTMYLSYNELEGYSPEPIELETEFYGLGSGVKSVNDCVYIRLFSDKMEKGEVKLSCQSLNETGRQSETKVFNITPDMWDKQTRTLFIRYQPKLQAATGFSVHITSPFNIATLQIAESAETVQNSKYNI